MSYKTPFVVGKAAADTQKAQLQVTDSITVCAPQ